MPVQYRSRPDIQKPHSTYSNTRVRIFFTYKWNFRFFSYVILICNKASGILISKISALYCHTPGLTLLHTQRTDIYADFDSIILQNIIKRDWKIEVQYFYFVNDFIVFWRFLISFWSAPTLLFIWSISNFNFLYSVWWFDFRLFRAVMAEGTSWSSISSNTSSRYWSLSRQHSSSLRISLNRNCNRVNSSSASSFSSEQFSLGWLYSRHKNFH